jgi:hypothetical protein
MSPSPEAPSSSSFSDATPFDGCDRWPLHYACRIGNLEHVKYLVNVAKLPLDEHDSHDASPLYLAALTGHSDICHFLLTSGAKCDPDSGGDAARVFYVALTPELRKLLVEWSLSAASRDPFLDLLRKTYNDPTRADTLCVINDTTIFLHRIILRARCPRLAALVISRSGEEDGESLAELRLPAEHQKSYQKSQVMVQLLEYLYTGVLETRDLETALVAQLLAHEYDLPNLYQRLEGSLERYLRGKDAGLATEVTRFRCDMSDLSLVRQDMAQLAQFVSTAHNEMDDIERLKELVELSDVMVQCEDCTWSLHSFILCAQSEYFKCALEGGFKEAQEHFVDLSLLLPCPEAVKLAIQWLYADVFLEEDHLPTIQVAIWLLDLGAAILCVRLVAYTTNTVLIPAVDSDNVFDMLELARIHSLERLEDRCVHVLAWNLMLFATHPRLVEVLAKDALEIVQTGDVRVIDVPIAAEMKSVISKQEELSREERMNRIVLLQKVVQQVLVV